MKKIIAIILVLASSLALFACGGGDSPVEMTVEYYGNSIPTKIVTKTVTEIVDEDDNVAYVLNGEQILVTGKVGGKLATVMTQSSEQLRTVSDGAGGFIVDAIEAISSSLEFYLDKGTRKNGGRWQADGLNFAPSKGSITLGITEDNVKNVTYTEAQYNNEIKFTVAYDKIGDVFGKDEEGNPKLISDTDIEVTITNNGAQITGIQINYSVEATDDYPAQNITVTTAYSYAAEVPVFVKEP